MVEEDQERDGGLTQKYKGDESSKLKSNVQACKKLEKDHKLQKRHEKFECSTSNAGSDADACLIVR